MRCESTHSCSNTAQIKSPMLSEYKHEHRRVRLPREVWLEIDSRAGRKGISISDMITEALQAYFDLTGHISEYPMVKAEADTGTVEDP